MLGSQYANLARRALELKVRLDYLTKVDPFSPALKGLNDDLTRLEEQKVVLDMRLAKLGARATLTRTPIEQVPDMMPWHLFYREENIAPGRSSRRKPGGKT